MMYTLTETSQTWNIIDLFVSNSFALTFSPRCIVKFSQLEPIIVTERAWKNFIFNLQYFALLDQFSFSHDQMSCLYVLCREKLGVDNWLGLKGLNNTNFGTFSFTLEIILLLLNTSSIASGAWRWWNVKIYSGWKLHFLWRK